jgi:hypothetical protein
MKFKILYKQCGTEKILATLEAELNNEIENYFPQPIRKVQHPAHRPQKSVGGTILTRSIGVFCFFEKCSVLQKIFFFQIDKKSKSQGQNRPFGGSKLSLRFKK